MNAPDETPLLPLAPETPPTTAAAASGTPAPPAPVDAAEIERLVVEVLRSTFDPEIPVNIYDLGLVYGIDVDPSGSVAVRMTLTSPACPVAGTLPGEVEQKVAGIPGVAAARVDLVWDPPWDPGKLSDAAKLQLGIM